MIWFVLFLLGTGIYFYFHPPLRWHIAWAVYVFNWYLATIECLGRFRGRLRHFFRTGKWLKKIGGVVHGRLKPPHVTTVHEVETLRSIHDFCDSVESFNCPSMNCGLHNTALEKVKLIYYIALVRGGGDPKDPDDWVGKWVAAAWAAHTAGKCVEHHLPDEDPTWDEYCPFCEEEED